MIIKLKEIPLEIRNDIDWETSPEEAIAMFLEWGQLRNQKYYIDSSDYVIFFTVQTWQEPMLFLTKISTASIDIIGKFEFPAEFVKGIYKHKGTYKISDELIAWVKQEMGF